jgi:uncharacterized membrane protein YciS (DUF1049 family)
VEVHGGFVKFSKKKKKSIKEQVQGLRAFLAASLDFTYQNNQKYTFSYFNNLIAPQQYHYFYNLLLLFYLNIFFKYLFIHFLTIKKRNEKQKRRKRNKLFNE